ncbi:MAG: restriction endonuclease [Nitrosomonas sp. PRO4]|nr:restriction endonuclease [Nitrosomonas sp. PRO4]
MGVALAIMAYILLQPYAVLEMSIQATPGQVGHAVVEQIGRMFVYYGQFILPLLFLSGALASFFKQAKRKNLVRLADSGETDDSLRGIGWKNFEMLIGEVFRMRGFTVMENDRGGADNGIDLMLKKNDEVFLVQCKQWRAYRVSVNVVRELLGVMVTKGASGGFVVTSGTFTSAAWSFSKGQNIELIDGSILKAMIKEANKITIKQINIEKTAVQKSMSSQFVVEPNCLRCGNAMSRRVATKGANSGKMFWGCVEFPRCRGIKISD